MIPFLQGVHILVCLILITAVLIQSGKGQGLAGTFGAVAGDTAQNLFGARTGDMLTRFTTYMAFVFFGLAVTLAVIQSRASESVLKDYIPPPAQSSETVTLSDQTLEIDPIPAPKTRTESTLESGTESPPVISLTDDPKPVETNEAETFQVETD